MNMPDGRVKHYSSARRRFLSSSIEQFLETEFPRTFGPVIRRKMSEKILDLIERQLPPKDFVKPGQCVWNVVSDKTRPDSPNCRLVPVILTLVNLEDIRDYVKGEKLPQIRERVIRRMALEAHEQGALLSMRDIGLLTLRSEAGVSVLRKAWEQASGETLPHVGSLQDFGSCITHKVVIVQKVVYEKKDPTRVADETKHSQWAVDRYLKDFHRVRTCYQLKPELDFIHQATGLSISLIKQYVKIIQENEKNA